MADTSEEKLNALLRKVDWRFLLRQRQTPLSLDLTRGGRMGEALTHVTEPGSGARGEAKLAVIGFPSTRRVRRAGAALRPGGEIACIWRIPRPLGTQRARARLERAGFTDVRFYWPGPSPLDPHFWLRLHDAAAARFLLTERPAASPLQRLLRLTWRAAARVGMLTPICGLASAPGRSANRANEAADAADPLVAVDCSLLLTGGASIVNKVVGVSIDERSGEPSVVAKFARTARSDSALDDEATTLGHFDPKTSATLGIPRVLAKGERVGRHALLQSAVQGRPLSELIAAETFPDLATQVSQWAIDLAKLESVESASVQEQLVSRPVDAFADFPREALDPAMVARTRLALAGLGELPLVCMHRDLKPWNIVLDGNHKLGVLDWEDAEVPGLPGVDLAFFLSTSAFLIDGVLLEAANTDAYLESYRRLLDPTTPLGIVAERCTAMYCQSLGIPRADFDRIRLLCWIIQAVNYHDPQVPMGPGPSDPNPFRTSLFVELAAEEIDRIEAAR